MISAREINVRLEEVLIPLPEGFDLASLSSAISLASSRVITSFLKEAVASTSDFIYKNIKEKYPRVKVDYSKFKKAFLDALRLLDPREMYKEAKIAFREHGKAMGIIFAVKNILTTFILPPLLLLFGLKAAAIFVAVFPSNVIFVPLLIKYFSIKAQI
jgi:hypothetical protein